MNSLNYTIYMDNSNLLGEGNYGSVRRCIHKQTQEICACKIIQLDKSQEQIIKREKDVLFQLCSKTNNKNIVQLYEYVLTDHVLYLFSEYCCQGNLKQLMEKKILESTFQTLPSGFIEMEVEQIMNDIISGYKSLFDLKIVHRDIKPENILIQNNNYKITDFGFARFVPNQYEQKQPLTQMRCTPIYGAPQLFQALNSSGYSALCDVWSCGIIYYELIFGQKPFPITLSTINQLINELQNIKKNKIQKPAGMECPEYMWKTVQKMLEYEEEDRLKWHDIFEKKVFEKKKIKIINEGNLLQQ